MDRDYNILRQEGYNNNAIGYEGRYNSRLGRAYHQLRCEKLVNVIRKQFDRVDSLDILEIGCGTGKTLDYLSNRYDNTYFGFDFSSGMLDVASSRLKDAKYQPVLMLGNVFEMPYRDGCFDVVYATRFIHQFRHHDKLKISDEIRRVLRPGGIVLLEAYSRGFNIINYFTRLGDADVYSNLEEHLIHYPSVAELCEVSGGRYNIEGLRFFGDRILNRILGYSAFANLNRLIASFPILRILMNEHWVIYSPKDNPVHTEPRYSSNDSLSSLDKILRCSKCKGVLDRLPLQTGWRCSACNLNYENNANMPNMLADQARTPDVS